MRENTVKQLVNEPLEAPAWTGDWLVGWLAAAGLVYRCRSVRLSWSAGPTPTALFWDATPEVLGEALPSEVEVAALAIARHRDDAKEFQRNPSHEDFAERAAIARRLDDWTLGATVSSLGVVDGGDLPHSPFDPSVPRGVTLHERLASSLMAVADGDTLLDSMRGLAQSSSNNGLGYDLRRLASSSVPGDNLVVDPLAEVMAFYGSLAFVQWGRRTRGWHDGSAFASGAFRWPCWTVPLDWPAIDGLLDLYYCGVRSTAVAQEFESVSYRPTATADTTRGFGSRPRALDVQPGPGR